MSVLSNQLLQLQQKQQLLLKQFAQLKRENLQLKKALSKRDIQLKNTEESMKDLQHNLDIVKLSKGVLDDKDKKELGKRLTDYIKEIDRCLLILNT